MREVSFLEVIEYLGSAIQHALEYKSHSPPFDDTNAWTYAEISLQMDKFVEEKQLEQHNLAHHGPTFAYDSYPEVSNVQPEFRNVHTAQSGPIYSSNYQQSIFGDHNSVLDYQNHRLLSNNMQTDAIEAAPSYETSMLDMETRSPQLTLRCDQMKPPTSSDDLLAEVVDQQSIPATEDFPGVSQVLLDEILLQRQSQNNATVDSWIRASESQEETCVSEKPRKRKWLYSLLPRKKQHHQVGPVPQPVRSSAPAVGDSSSASNTAMAAVTDLTSCQRPSNIRLSRILNPEGISAWEIDRQMEPALGNAGLFHHLNPPEPNQRPVSWPKSRRLRRSLNINVKTLTDGFEKMKIQESRNEA